MRKIRKVLLHNKVGLHVCSTVEAKINSSYVAITTSDDGEAMLRFQCCGRMIPMSEAEGEDFHSWRKVEEPPPDLSRHVCCP